VLVIGRGRELTARAIFEVVKGHALTLGTSVWGQGKVIKKEVGELSLLDIFRNDVFIIPCDEKNISKNEQNFLFTLLERASQFFLIFTHLGEPHPDKIIFASERDKEETGLSFIKSLPRPTKCIFNIDDELVVELKESLDVVCHSFGFDEHAEFRASDIVITESPAPGINFKLNHEGKIIPVWLRGLFGKEYIYAALAAAVTGSEFDVNLVEVSQALSNYRGVPGRMVLIPGIKNTMILDDSASASVFSMAEGIEILGKIAAKRKIAVLGDVLEVGKYAIEAHESLGERAAKNVDLLFTVGLRAKFIAEAARNKGFAENNIFSFNTAKEAATTLKEKIEEGDFILVDGSREMRMEEVVNTLKAQ